ncbi:MAG: Dipeptide transport system permease protein DppB [uncultured Thermomicrobiales bacterium]|uniref:Dipeptide transport system permease protein DppB n=1 Tax=uncultured Thermomicrobiales bacterium TaxID=1645740 RepID=A0A6J4UQP5_9BACT|nr:MAG: Dipeptide transport system permease protein DppB [uncultured Thermomicrobiales bacterium]
MTRYLLRRLCYLVPVWLGISFVAFGLANLTPGDPARLMLQRDLGRQPTAEEVRQTRDELRLDAPFAVRYARWLGGAVTGDLGTSYRTGEPVARALLERFPRTLQIAALGLAGAILVALPLGMMAAVWRNSPVDHLSRVVALFSAAMPSYWVAYLLILAFAVRLQVLPVAGQGTWRHLVLPSLTLGLASTATLMRLTRSEMLNVLGQDFIRTGRAKGLSPRAVNLRHALRNALIPVTTVVGLRFAGLLGGAVIVETIFAWPGIGKYVLDSIFDRDYPVIQGFVVFMGSVFLLINLIVDVSYGLLDPRIRLAR